MTITSDLPLAGTTPRVGAKVIATHIPLIDGNEGYSEEMRRQVVTVKEVEDRQDHNGGIRIWAEFLSDPNDPDSYKHSWYFYEWKPAEEAPTVEPEVSPEVATLRGTIENLNQALESERTRLRETRANFDRSMEIISRRLNGEAENRGWCDEFDRIVEDVNADLPGPYFLEKRRREFEVQWTEKYTVTVHRSATIMAESDEEAIDEVREWDEADTYDLKEAIDNGNYEFDSADDYEAEEQ